MVEATSFYDIVVNADTIISLRNPCSEFAVWDEPSTSCIPAPPEEPTPQSPVREEDPFRGLSRVRRKMLMKKMERRRRVEQSEASISTPSVPASEPIDTISEDGDAASAIVDGSLGQREDGQSLFGAGSSAVIEVLVPVDSESGDSESGDSESGDSISNTASGIAQDLEVEPTATIKLVDEPAVEFRVCAGNLMSASPWFNRVLTKDGWMESHSGPEDRFFRISAEDWDEEAFVILMNVFHLRNRSVPRTVSLEMLAKIAILADYYECGESLDMFVDIWTTWLRKRSPVPTIYCRDLILWIWISLTFKLPDLFEEATSVAIRQAVGPVQSLELPIPAWVINEIDRKRDQLIESVISWLYGRLDVYRSAKYRCTKSAAYSFQCGSMLLGALTKAMDSAQLIFSRPSKPFPGLSFDVLCSQIRTMESGEWYESYSKRHRCELSTDVCFIVDALIISGLELDTGTESSPRAAST